MQLKLKKSWVLWKKEARAGQMTKIPYSVNGSLASSVDENTWSHYDDVVNKRKQNPSYGVGFVLPLDNSIVAVDIDHCLDEDFNIIDKKFQELVEKADSYTEISPSGTGVHVFFSVPETIKLERNRSKKCPGFEVYSSGRYMTFTENIYGKEKDVREVTRKELLDILATIGYPWNEHAESKAEIGKISPIQFNDFEIIERMFSAKNGDKIKKLYNGDTSEYNNDKSGADMALCIHLAFWTQKDPERIERLWINSPLGQREKTQDRQDYRDRTVKQAIASTSQVYSPTPEETITYSLNLMVDKKGNPLVNIVNLEKIIENDPLLSVSIRRNAFSDENETNLGTKYSDEREWRPIGGGDEMLILKHLQKNYSFLEKVSKQFVNDAIFLYCYEKNQVNEIVNWIESLEWDGEHRLNHWLTHAFGVEDNEYHSAVGANWFKGLVKRVIHPGSKMDYMIVLEGQQGLGKSSSLTVLGKGYHAETVLDLGNKDFFMLLKRNIIVEFSEGYTMSRADSRIMKSVITMQEDNIRAPYEKYVQRYKRRCVFAMTTNEDQYLRDETGNRRYLPVKLTRQADIEWLENNVDQLYAEAYKRVIEDKESYWEFPKEETEAMQTFRMVENPYSEKLLNWYKSLGITKQNEGITTLDAYTQVWLDGISMGREMNISQAMQVASQLDKTLCLSKRQKMKDGERSYRWYPTDKTNEIIKDIVVSRTPAIDYQDGWN